MTITCEPLHNQSLKQVCIEHLQRMILSGALQIGEKLPAERDLARQLAVSRPVVHEALVELAAQGLVTIQPRHGVIINDFRNQGSIPMLAALLAFNRGDLAPSIFQNMVDMRRLLETEIARCAALQRTPEQLRQFDEIMTREAQTGDLSERIELDFAFHLLLAVASGNLIYSLLINSFKQVYTNLTGRFFAHFLRTPIADEVIVLQRSLVAALAAADPAAAMEAMQAMLAHGTQFGSPANFAGPTHPSD